MKYIGTKTVTAEPMTRAAYNEFRGWQLPADENGADEGYLVEYQDGGKPNVPGRAGYVSWSPKEQFDAAYRPCTAMTFGLALEAMKRGEKVARAGWNGADQWVCLGAGRIELPAAEFWNQHVRQFAKANGGSATVRPYFILKTAQGDILMGWSPSQSDALAEDWLIVAAPATSRLSHQQRVIDEQRELEDRTEKLRVFITENGLFSTLPDDEQQRLYRQLEAMRTYSEILAERIAAFPVQ